MIAHSKSFLYPPVQHTGWMQGRQLGTHSSSKHPCVLRLSQSEHNTRLMVLLHTDQVCPYRLVLVCKACHSMPTAVRTWPGLTITTGDTLLQP